MALSMDFNCYAHGVKTVAIEVAKGDGGTPRLRLHLVDENGLRDHCVTLWGATFETVPEIVLIEQDKPTVTLWKAEDAQKADA